MTNGYDFRRFAGVKAPVATGINPYESILSGLLGGLSARGAQQKQQDVLERERRATNIGYAQKGIDPSRMQDPEYLSQIAQRQAGGTGLFGESKDPFISAVRISQDPRFEQLPEETRQNIQSFITTRARAPETLGSQAFATKTGQLQAQLGLEPQLAGEVATEKKMAELGTKREFERAARLRATGLGVEKTRSINEKILNTLETNPELVGGFSDIKAKATRFGAPGFDAEQQEKRGALIRGLSEAQNKAMALATAAGQSGINIQAEIDRITQGLQPTNTAPEIKGALKAMQDLEVFVESQLGERQQQTQQFQQPVQQQAQQPVQQQEPVIINFEDL